MAALNRGEPRTEGLPFVAACAVMGNEKLHAREWVEYHLAIGVNQIYLFDNPANSSIRTQSGLKGLYPPSLVKITSCVDLYPTYKRAVARVEKCNVPTCTAMVRACLSCMRSQTLAYY